LWRGFTPPVVAAVLMVEVVAVPVSLPRLLGASGP
jgi:hypothetical protein